jgi:hypothetical protein
LARRVRILNYKRSTRSSQFWRGRGGARVRVGCVCVCEAAPDIVRCIYLSRARGERSAAAEIDRYIYLSRVRRAACACVGVRGRRRPRSIDLSIYLFIFLKKKFARAALISSQAAAFFVVRKSWPSLVRLPHLRARASPRPAWPADRPRAPRHRSTRHSKRCARKKTPAPLFVLLDPPRLSFLLSKPGARALGAALGGFG